MLFLSIEEKQLWEELANEVVEKDAPPAILDGQMRQCLIPAFHCYMGTRLTREGKPETGRDWLSSGALEEGEGQFFNAYLSGFLGRSGGRLAILEKVFADPRPYIHLTTVPLLRDSRVRFLEHCLETLPVFSRPLRFADLGCGDGSLTAAFVKSLLENGKVSEIGEIVLVDRSPGMLEKALETLGRELPGVPVKTVEASIEEFAEKNSDDFDLMLSALAYHHMPWEQKKTHLEELAPHTGHFVLFEMDANNDLPELGSPELLLSVYQSYGRLIDRVFTHDAAVDLALDCVDGMLMPEAVSLLTEPRGKRNDYHMMRSQWRGLFSKAMPGFSCLMDTASYEDECVGLFTMHYAR